MPKKKRYTIAEAAKRLKVSRQGVLKAIKAGKLKARIAIIPQKGWVISADSLEAYQVSKSHQERGLKNP